MVGLDAEKKKKDRARIQYHNQNGTIGVYTIPNDQYSQFNSRIKEGLFSTFWKSFMKKFQIVKGHLPELQSAPGCINRCSTYGSIRAAIPGR